MAMMKMVVFDVEHGQCVFIRTPNDYGILIDCGRGGSSPISSPVQWLVENEAPSLKHCDDYPLAGLIITHPKSGSIKDLSAVTEKLPPSTLWCDTDYDWQHVIASDNSKVVAAYHSWLSTVEANTEPDIDLGVEIKRFSLSQSEAEQLGEDFVDNRSIVTIITYRSDEGYVWKVVISGDNTTQGWEALLSNSEFTKEINEADFFVTSRNGHQSGFSTDLFTAMGKPIANISSGVEINADKRYAKTAQGVKFPDGSRKHLVTGGDGNITVEMHDDGRYDVWLFRP